MKRSKLDLLRRPGGRALFQKRGQAFLCLGGGAALGDRRGGQRNGFFGVFPRDVCDETLGCGDGLGSRGKERLDLRPPGRLETVRRNDGVHETDPVRFPRVEAVPGQKEVARLARSDGAQDIRGDDGRKDPEPDFREREDRPFRGDRDVRRGNEPDAPSDRRAVRERDDRLGARIDRAQHARHPHGVRLILVARVTPRLSHPGDIGSGAEDGPFSRQDHHASLRVGRRIGKGAGQFLDERLVEGVAHLRPGEHHARDGALPQTADAARLRARAHQRGESDVAPSGWEKTPERAPSVPSRPRNSKGTATSPPGRRSISRPVSPASRSAPTAQSKPAAARNGPWSTRNGSSSGAFSRPARRIRPRVAPPPISVPLTWSRYSAAAIVIGNAKGFVTARTARPSLRLIESAVSSSEPSFTKGESASRSSTMETSLQRIDPAQETAPAPATSAWTRYSNVSGRNPFNHSCGTPA